MGHNNVAPSSLIRYSTPISTGTRTALSTLQQGEAGKIGLYIP